MHLRTAKNRRGSNRPAGSPGLPGAGRRRAYANMRILLADAAPLLNALNALHSSMAQDDPAARGLAALIAGLWTEINAAKTGGRKGTTMTAQNIYDLDIDGTEIHTILQQLTGDPSPAGRTPVSTAAVLTLADEYASAIADPIGRLRDIARQLRQAAQS